MSSIEKNVGLSELTRGLLQIVPEWRAVRRSAIQLASLQISKYQSIGSVIEYWARKTPDNIALRFENRQWSYAEFNAWANRISACLAAQGVRSGDSVAILMENRPEVLACVAAVVKLGGVAAMLNHNQRGEVLAHSIRLVNPRVIVVGEECAETLSSTPYAEPNRAMPLFWCRGDEDQAPPEGFRDLLQESNRLSARNPRSTGKVASEQPCFYIFTSGTTGLPKASIMTHYRWLASRGGLSGSIRLSQDDIFYCCLPLYHNNALTVSWSCVLGAGATLAIDRKFSASRFWDQVRHHRATAFCYIGELLRYLLNQPASPRDLEHHVRLIVGNGLRPELWNQFESRFGIERIYEFYGASESNIGFINFFGVSQTAGFTPLPFAIVEFDAEEEIPIRDGHGFMRRVSRGGVGLLISQVNDRQPFDGYTDAKASEKKLLRDVFEEGDCWFNSGDLVRDQGFRHIQFVDRVGDTFRWKGENVATSEVEGQLAGDESLEHAVVYGVTVPGSDGRAGMAAISLKPDAVLDGQALAQRLIAVLPAYAVPLFLRLRAEQQTTGTFKYRKVELKNEAFDPAKVSEPLYVLLDWQKGYEPLTPEIHLAIRQGDIRL